MLNDLIFTVGASNVRYAFSNSDGMGQLVVGLLFLGSILTWTIMLEKGINLFKAKKISEDFMELFKKNKSVHLLLKDIEEKESPVSSVYEHGIMKLGDFYRMNKTDFINLENCFAEKKLSLGEIEAIQTAMERSVSEEILKLEEGIGMLATAVSVSPFFGLFGTVWGVMMAFCGVAIAGNADISALAPGVSGALLTTVVGLLVAIPSLIGYNILTSMIRKITIYMDNFSDEFIAELKIEQLETFEKNQTIENNNG